MEIVKLNSTSHVNAARQIDNQAASVKTESHRSPTTFKSVDVEDTDVIMVENAALLMQDVDTVDMTRVQELKERMARGELEFSMKDVARALVRS